MRTLLLFAATAAFLPGQTTAPEMRPFVMDWRDNAGALVDVSFLLDKPAGKAGFIAVRDGHLSTADGKRLRFWGFNVSMMAGMPDKADAPQIAAHLARLGVNCVRFHHMDWLQPRGYIDASREDTQRIVPELLDRVDFFISELKKNGIYADLNLNVGRRYKAGDKVRDWDKLGFAKGITYFDERIIELQKDYARQLLTHFNPYTKSEYRNEPAVAIVEIVNENSLVEAWLAGRLRGKQTSPPAGDITWCDIPPSYEQALTAKFQAWLKERGKEPVARLDPQEIASASPERFRAELQFYMDLEERFFREMRSYLRDKLGVKQLLIATSDHNQGLSGYPLLHSTSQLDIVDGHAYWQHPDRQGRIVNTPMVDDPLRSTVVRLARSAFAGKPYIVSELDHPYPAEHAAEAIPLTAAYAALQNWDGIFWYSFEHAVSTDWKPAIPGPFCLRADPVRMTALPSGALMFLRGDVAAAKQVMRRSYSLEDVYDSARAPRSLSPYFIPGFPLSEVLQHQVRIETLEGSPTTVFQPASEPPIASDTSELVWDKGLFTAETERSEAVVGSRAKPLEHMAVEVRNGFAAVTLQSLDDAPIDFARRLLLTATARSANSGAKWDEGRHSLTDKGTAPTVIEPVVGSIVLRNLEGARAVRAAALTAGAKPAGDPVQAELLREGWRIPLGDSVTTWYLITVER